MSPELLSLLLEGGSLVAFIVFVIYMGKEQTKERESMSDERKANNEAMLKVLTDERSRSDNQMQLGLDGLDKVATSIGGLTAANAELSQVIAVHDNKTDANVDRVLDKLESIKNGG